MAKTDSKKEKPRKVPKFFRDILEDKGESAVILPSSTSPICKKCNLDKIGECSNPYLPESGSKNPKITVVLDSVSARADEAGDMMVHGQASYLKSIMTKIAEKRGLDMKDVRFVGMTRCGPRFRNKINFKIKSNWCRYFTIQDIASHPPSLIMPVGSVALGRLSHKGDAQNWSGKVLTYRGWPDDWVTNPAFDEGHPVFGAKPDLRIPMVPVQSPFIVQAQQNQAVTKAWIRQIDYAIRCAVDGVKPLSYDRPWYRISTDADEIASTLKRLAKLKTRVTYDTETTGLKMFQSDERIVFMMFRWNNPDGKPDSIGFPWDYAESPLLKSVDRLTPYVLNVLYSSRIQGHNLSFDSLFTFSTLKGADLDKIADAMDCDTWHMLFALRQERASFGLENITYKWCPDLAGYEEEMTLLIEKYGDLLNPANGKGGHYAKCPPELWDSHLKPYVMGDVESCHISSERIRDELDKAPRYKIPLASFKTRGRFRYFEPPSRGWVYNNVMAPGNQLITKLMGRGVQVDIEELTNQEHLYPKQIGAAKNRIREETLKVSQWCGQNEATIPGWEFDLEEKKQLKTVLFQILEMPILKLTKSGIKLYGEDIENLDYATKLKYASCDKFTLNALAAKHSEIRPLLDYRKVYKQYTSFVKPLRNCYDPTVDKKRRDKPPHLMPDGRIHASFMLTGTRGGRLSCREPNLQQLAKDGVIKRLYVSRFGPKGCIYQGDLSQIELRLLAAACGDESMVNAYLRDMDLHALTQSRIPSPFTGKKRKYEECLKEHMEWLQSKGKDKEAKQIDLERRIAKIVNFLTGYGGGAYGLMAVLAASGIYLSEDECLNIIESFFDTYPALRQHIQYYKHFIAENACAVSIFGRVRIMDEVNSDSKSISSKALRAGYNHLIQSSASDIMLICLFIIEGLMRSENLKSVLVLTVHDSLVIDAMVDELDAVHRIVTSVIENIPEVLQAAFGPEYDNSWCIVPFGGDYSVGNNYLDDRKIPKGAGVDWEKLLITKG